MTGQNQYETYNELSAFDRDFAPQSGRRPGIDTLHDGIYDFEILSAELTRTEKTNELILRVSLRVLNTVTTVEHCYFFRNQTAVDILGSDLCTLGFDADKWKAPASPFSAMLPRVVPMLTGLRFNAKKTTSPNPKDATRPYSNLLLNRRLESAHATTAPAAYIPSHVPPTPAQAAAVADDDTIPW